LSELREGDMILGVACLVTLGEIRTNWQTLTCMV